MPAVSREKEHNEKDLPLMKITFCITFFLRFLRCCSVQKLKDKQKPIFCAHAFSKSISENSAGNWF